jgi:hypothetical protein
LKKGQAKTQAIDATYAGKDKLAKPPVLMSRHLYRTISGEDLAFE